MFYSRCVLPLRIFLRYGLPEAALMSALLQVESVAPWQISDSVVLFVGGVICGRCFFLAVSGLYGEENARSCRRGGGVRAAMLCCPGNHRQRQPGHISCR
jgi:hypothetical protein